MLVTKTSKSRLEALQCGQIYHTQHDCSPFGRPLDSMATNFSLKNVLIFGNLFNQGSKLLRNLGIWMDFCQISNQILVKLIEPLWLSSYKHCLGDFWTNFYSNLLATLMHYRVACCHVALYFLEVLAYILKFSSSSRCIFKIQIQLKMIPHFR